MGAISYAERGRSRTVTIALKDVGEPIAGEISSPDQPPRPFTGWLQLLSELQDTVEMLRAAPADADPTPHR